MVAEDLFLLISHEHGLNLNQGGCNSNDTAVMVSFFEIYGGRIQDLLNKCNRLKVLEDGKGEVVITGLKEFEADNAKHLLELIESANK